MYPSSVLLASTHVRPFRGPRWCNLHRGRHQYKSVVLLHPRRRNRLRSTAVPAPLGPSADGEGDRLYSNLSATTSGSSESDDGVVRIPLNLPRRSLQVTFTCNKCDTRTERLVNPQAWEKGTVFAQCSGCSAWHKLRDEAGLIEEVKFVDELGNATS